MICELWVKGTAENGGHKEIDGLWMTGIQSGDPLPTVSFNSHDGRGWDYYNDGSGGTFGGTGWYGAPTLYLKNCTGTDKLKPNQPHDCINGSCLPSTVYHTAGIFANLAACQAGCAKNSNCTGECVDPAEIAALQQAANALKQRMCS